MKLVLTTSSSPETNQKWIWSPSMTSFPHNLGGVSVFHLTRLRFQLKNSLNFGLFHHNKQIGFARVISDFSTIAYLGDIYVLEDYRGQGLSSKLMEVAMNHPNLQGLRRWILLTSTADWLYRKYHFRNLPNPELYIELYDPDVYKNNL